MGAVKKEDSPLFEPAVEAALSKAGVPSPRQEPPNGRPFVVSEEELEERRTHSDSQERDRRVIARLGHPELRKYMRFTASLCNIGVLACIAYIGGLIARHVHDSNLELNRSIFFGVVLTVLASGIGYLGSAIRSYVENESQQRLIAVSERLFKAFFLFLVTGVILAVVNVITWF